MGRQETTREEQSEVCISAFVMLGDFLFANAIILVMCVLAASHWDEVSQFIHGQFKATSFRSVLFALWLIAMAVAFVWGEVAGIMDLCVYSRKPFLIFGEKELTVQKRTRVERYAWRDLRSADVTQVRGARSTRWVLVLVDRQGGVKKQVVLYYLSAKQREIVQREADKRLGSRGDP